MKRLGVIAGCLVAAAGVAVAGYVKTSLSIASTYKTQCSVERKNQNYIVGVIGDSWIAGGKLDDGLIKGISSRGIGAVVKSSGYPGARSKLIYENFEQWMNWIETAYSDLRTVYVIEGGINDSLAYVGKDFYVQHMKLAVGAALACGGKAVVLSIPAYDRSKMQRSAFTNFRWAVYRWLSNDDIGDNAEDYNESLAKELSPLIAEGQVKIIDLRAVLPSDAFVKSSNDGVHLTPKAYDAMAVRVGQEVADFIRSGEIR